MGKLQLVSKINTMAQAFNSLDETARSQMACTFAALMLHDDRTEVNASSIQKVCDAAGVKVPAYWPMLFATALNGKDIGSFLSVSAGSAPQQTGGATNAPAGGAKEEAKKEEEPEEEEEDMDLGDLFG